MGRRRIGCLHGNPEWPGLAPVEQHSVRKRNGRCAEEHQERGEQHAEG